MYHVLRKSPITVPKASVFREKMRELSLVGSLVPPETPATAAAKLEASNVSGYLSHSCHRLLENDGNTLLVSRFQGPTTSTGVPVTSHLHVDRYPEPFSLKVALSGRSQDMKPWVAIVFESKGKYMDAVTLFQAKNLEGKKPWSFNFRQYRNPDQFNILWVLEAGNVNVHEIANLVRKLLPAGTYVPSYSLHENPQCGLPVRFKNSPQWLLDQIPPLICARGWWLSPSSQAHCSFCDEEQERKGKNAVRPKPDAAKADAPKRVSPQPTRKLTVTLYVNGFSKPNQGQLARLSAYRVRKRRFVEV